MKEYQVINILEGIYEEYVRDNDKDYMERNTALTEAVKALTEIQYYRAIGTVEECREARERKRAEKPVKDECNHDCCPNCGWVVYQEEWGGRYLPHCENCGQAIDWGDTP